MWLSEATSRGVVQYRALLREIEHLEKQILAWHRHDEVSQRLATIPGIGPITASAIAMD